MARAWAINEDSGQPEYNAQELRRISSAWLFPGVSDRFGARAGVRPHSGPVLTVSGSTWTAHDLTAVVYPGETSISGPYVVEHAEESGSINPADGSNPRIDAVHLQVRDDDEDGSGERDVRLVYTAGTPASSPTAPAGPAGALLIGSILVPAGGSPSPSVASLAAGTVASGGILPVTGAGQLPTAGRHEGMYSDLADADVLQRWSGSAWQSVASPGAFALAAAMAGLQFAATDGPHVDSTSAFGALTGGPEVTAVVPASGRVLVMWGGRVLFDANGGSTSEVINARMRVMMSGANAGVVGGSDNRCQVRRLTTTTANTRTTPHPLFVATGLTPGSTTFTAQYAISNELAEWRDRVLLVVPL